MNVLIDSTTCLALAWGECEFTPEQGQEVIQTTQCLCSTKIWKWNSQTEEFEVVGEVDLYPDLLRGCCSLINDVKLSYINGHQIEIGRGCARSDDNECFMPVEEELIVDLEVSGAGGLDEGTEAANTWYYVWLIKNLLTNAVAGLLSASSSEPTLPVNFFKKRLLGVVRNDLNSDLLDFYMSGAGKARRIFYREDITILRVLSAGGAIVWTAIDCSSLIPPISRLGYFEFAQTNAAGYTAWLGVNGLSERLRFIKNNGVSISWSETDAQQKVEYKNNMAGGLTYLDVLGYEIEL